MSSTTLVLGSTGLLGQALHDLPDELVRGLHTTAAHSTLVLADTKEDRDLAVRTLASRVDGIAVLEALSCFSTILAAPVLWTSISWPSTCGGSVINRTRFTRIDEPRPRHSSWRGHPSAC